MKKTIKSTISIILALCMLLASLAACEKEEPNNDDHIEENSVPIKWQIAIDEGAKGFSYDEWEEMPENFFDYWYAELPKDTWRTLEISLVFDYRYNFEDMPQEFQKQHNDFIEKYGSYTHYSPTSEEEIKSKNELRMFAYDIAYETAKNYYESFEFQSSISPNLKIDEYWDNKIGFKHFEGYILFKFMYDTSPYSHAYSHDSHDFEANVFDTWEWRDKIDELAKIPGIKEVRVLIDQMYVGDCT